MCKGGNQSDTGAYIARANRGEGAQACSSNALFWFIKWPLSPMVPTVLVVCQGRTTPGKPADGDGGVAGAWVQARDGGTQGQKVQCDGESVSKQGGRVAGLGSGEEVGWVSGKSAQLESHRSEPQTHCDSATYGRFGGVAKSAGAPGGTRVTSPTHIASVMRALRPQTTRALSLRKAHVLSLFRRRWLKGGQKGRPHCQLAPSDADIQAHAFNWRSG